MVCCQGRVDPVPMVNKQDSGGIGRLEMEVGCWFSAVVRVVDDGMY